MAGNIIVRSPPPPPSLKGKNAKPPATTTLKSGSCAPSCTSPFTKNTHVPRPTVSKSPTIIDGTSPPSANKHPLKVTLPLRERARGSALTGKHGNDGIMKSRIPYRPIYHDCPRVNDMDKESCRVAKCADVGLHQSAASLRVIGTKSMSEHSSKSRRRGPRGQQPLPLGFEGLVYSSTAVDKEPSKRYLSPPATPPSGRFQSSERPSPWVSKSRRGSKDSSLPFSGPSQQSKLSGSSNTRVVSRVSKRSSSTRSRTSRRCNQRVQQRFSIERRLTLVPDADSSKNDTRAQRFSIAKENTEKLLKGAMSHAYRYLRWVEPNLPDITLDGLEAIVNDLVHTINDRDPSREIEIRGGRLGGQLLDTALAEGLEGHIMSCGKDAEFDPVIQLPPWQAI